MLVLLSPAMRMRELHEYKGCVLEKTKPEFFEKTQELASLMRSYDIDELGNILRVSGETLVNYYLYWQDFPRTFNASTTVHAAFAFSGIAYTYFDAETLSISELAYAQDHVRILSGAYGVLRPLDGVSPYRLEMQSKIQPSGAKNLYEFWGNELAKAVLSTKPHIIINALSSEYAKAIMPHVSDEVPVITPDFKIHTSSGYKTQSTWAKMCRGTLARWVSTNQITSPKDILDFDFCSFRFEPALSTEDKPVFIADHPTPPKS